MASPGRGRTVPTAASRGQKAAEALPEPDRRAKINDDGVTWKGEKGARCLLDRNSNRGLRGEEET